MKGREKSEGMMKRIKLELTLPVTVELDVEWDSEEERAVIKGGHFAHIQNTISERFIGEHCDEDSLQAIDDATRGALRVGYVRIGTKWPDSSGTGKVD